MSKLTRLQACKLIRKDSLITLLQGEQIIGNKPHYFSVELFVHPMHKGKIAAVFQSKNSPNSYGIQVTGKQVLRFLRRYYKRYEN